MNFWEVFSDISALVFGSYLVFSIGGYIFFYKILGPSIKHREILDLDKRELKPKFEFKYSLISMFIFIAVGMLLAFLTDKGWTNIYTEWDEYGVLYFIASFFIIHHIHDAYFYWTHKWMHEVKWLRPYHAIHHAVKTPTPLAAFTFHPVEAMVHGLYWILISMFVPVSAHMLFIFYAFMHYINMWGHCCFEFWTVDLMKKMPWKVLNTPTHHVIHHKYNKLNYSIYYNFWDDVNGTNHPNYEKDYDEVKKRTVAGRKSKLMEIFNL